MPYNPSSPRFRAIAMALAIALAGALAAAGPASAAKRSIRAYAKHGNVYYFKLKGLKASRVKSAKVVVAGHRWRVSRRRLRAGVRHRRLRAHAPRRIHVALMRSFSSAASKPSKAKLVIRLRGRRHRRSGAGGGDSRGTTGGGGGDSSPLTGPITGNTAPCDAHFGQFGTGRWPSACWRPYSDSSPFNRRLPSDPRLVGNSDQIVNRVVGFGPLQHITAGRAGTNHDYAHPTYWSTPDDPWFTIHCTEHWGDCALEGVRIQIPDKARPAGGEDGHMTVVDQRSGWEYDMWQVQRKPAGGGQLVTTWGGKTRIDGDGRGSDAVAAEYGTMAGKIREEELEAGQINHALFMFVNCDSGRAVYPAVHGGRACNEIGESNTNAPSMGQRFQLDMSDGEIAALDVPQWKKTILRAIAHYGMYVGDTGGSWGVKEEGGLTYTSMGYKDKWVELAKKVGAPYYAPDDDYIFNLRDGVDWKHRLRVVDPCEGQGTC